MRARPRSMAALCDQRTFSHSAQFECEPTEDRQVGVESDGSFHGPGASPGRSGASAGLVD